MAEPDSDTDPLLSLLAAVTGSTVEEIEAGAASFEFADPEDAEWEVLPDE